MKRRFVTNEKRSVPRIDMISLANIILIVLLFFAMSTHVQKDKLKIGEVEPPQATELKGAVKTSIVANIYITKPSTDCKSYIQLNKKVVTMDSLEKEIKKIRAALKEDERSLMTVMLKVDRDAPMGVVTDVKQVLRRSNVLNIIYSARF